MGDFNRDSRNRGRDSVGFNKGGNPGNFNRGFNRGPGQFSGPKEMHKATCSDCGNECEVPFKPDGDRPVYCGECFDKRKKK